MVLAFLHSGFLQVEQATTINGKLIIALPAHLTSSSLWVTMDGRLFTG
jgi:hypothetical protein